MHEKGCYDARQVVDNVIPRVGRYTQNVPIFKYLRQIGIDDTDAYEKSGLPLDKWVKRDLKDFRVKMYSAPFFRKYRHQTMRDVIDGCTPESASAFIPFFSRDKIDLDLLHHFLMDNEEKLDSLTSNYASNFRKLVTLYDKLKWGW